MAYSISIILWILPILVSSLLIPTAFSAGPLYKLCSNNTITNTTNYANSLKYLLGNLSLETPKTGFSNLSSDSSVFGFALCSNDISPDDCRACVQKASTQIKSCNYSQEAVIWYDYCHLKYSDHNFFGKYEAQHPVRMYNTKNQEHPDQFRATVRDTLLNISKQVDQESKWFARHDAKLSKHGSAKLYTVAKCSWDLTQKLCKECLEDAVNSLIGFSSNDQGKNLTVPRGGRTLTPNCIVRYETYGFLFYNY